MKNRILDHFGLKFISLVIAVVIWIIVANVDDYKTTKRISGIEIEFINGDAITKKNKVYEVPEGTTVDIIVKGRRKVVEELNSESFKAVADLSEMSITNAVMVKVSPVNTLLEKELSITYTDNAVNVVVEDEMEVQLPISVRVNSEVAEGYAIKSKTAAPNLIKVTGAKSVVNTIQEVVVDINVKNANHGLTAYATPVFIDKNGNEIMPNKLEYDVQEVEVSVEVMKTKELPIEIETKGEPKAGYAIASLDYQPTSILVVGETDALADMDALVIDDIDVTDCEKDLETSITISDYLPTGITLADTAEEIMVKVAIEPIEEKRLTLLVDDISIIGRDKNYEYTFKGDTSYALKIKGLRDHLQDFKVADLTPCIDVSEYKSGTYKFTVHFKDIEGIEVLQGATVKLEITQKEQEE